MNLRYLAGELLLLNLLARPIALACSTGAPGCICPTNPPPEPQAWSWVSESTVGSAATNHSYPVAPSRNWKLFPDKIQDVVKDVQSHRRAPSALYPYLSLIGISTLLFTVIALLIFKGIMGPELRRLFQILFLILWVFVFAQCLCSVKDVAVLVAYAREGKLLYGLCTAWLALLTMLFTLIIGRRFRSFFCFWACPVGAVQDLTETGLHRKASARLKITLLGVIGIVLVAMLAWKVPRPLNLLGGGVLALLMIVFAVLAILRPSLDPVLRKFVIPAMLAWFLLNLSVMLYDVENKTPGPWCVPGVANFRYPLVLIFLVLIAVSMIVPRAWCNYVCPNRGLFNLLSGRRGPTDTSAPRLNTNHNERIRS